MAIQKGKRIFVNIAFTLASITAHNAGIIRSHSLLKWITNRKYADSTFLFIAAVREDSDSLIRSDYVQTKTAPPLFFFFFRNNVICANNNVMRIL